MLSPDLKNALPSTEELPCSDDTPVDEVYKLLDGNYQQQIGEPYWMPEVGLGIGRYRGIVAGIQQELLSWYDKQGDRYLTAEERAEQLAQYLRSRGIDPDNLPNE